MIPFLDLKRIHEPLQEAFVDRFRDLLNRSAFVNGPEVIQFEEAFSKWVGTKYCVGVSSGLDAEVIGLRALGLMPGEKVLVPAMTFHATYEAVSFAGGEPVPVDVDENGLIDLNQVKDAVKSGIRWVLPVHLYGQLVNPEVLRELKEQMGAVLFEDAAQAHGAKKMGYSAGTLGQMAAFSFYPGKNLGALGDAGALVTSEASYLDVAKALREHGQTAKYVHQYEGYTARLDNLQAAFLSVKLPHLTEWTQQRIKIARQYSEGLQGLSGIKLQNQGDDFTGGHVYHLYVVLAEKREQLGEALKKASIGYGLHYPIANHKLGCYQSREFSRKSFPNAERYAAHALSLPIFPGMTEVEVDRVIRAVRDA